MESNVRPWLIGLLVALCLVLLIAFARNNPGVGGRQPDPPTTTTVIATTNPTSTTAHAAEPTTVAQGGSTP